MNKEEVMVQIKNALNLASGNHDLDFTHAANQIFDAVTAHNHEAAREAVESERLVEPTNEADDVAYECAISHAQHAISATLNKEA